jgi:hypothetical protein
MISDNSFAFALVSIKKYKPQRAQSTQRKGICFAFVLALASDASFAVKYKKEFV